jgi:hypothetical protein
MIKMIYVLIFEDRTILRQEKVACMQIYSNVMLGIT